MSTYQKGVEAYRATAKWLVSLVPIAAALAAGFALGPDLVDSARTLSLGGFFAERWPTVVGIALIAGGIAIIVWQATKIMSLQAPDVNNLESTELEEAFGAGVAAPFFTDLPAYTDARSQLLAWTDAQRSGYTLPTGAIAAEKPDATLVKALEATTDGLRDWFLHRDIASRFGRFSNAYLFGIALAIAGFVTASIDLRSPERLETPVAVEAIVSDELAEEIRSSLGCDSRVEMADLQFWLVAGDWKNPVLQVDGPGCVSTIDWDPSRNVAIRPTK